jgi:Transposase DDE domain
MSMRHTTKISQGHSYPHALLVESVHPPKGPRQRTSCSLGSLAPGPREQGRALARTIEVSLGGQRLLEPTAPQSAPTVEQAPPGSKPPRPPARARQPAAQGGPVAPAGGALEAAREAGPGPVGHQMGQQLGLEAMLPRVGVSARARLLSDVMTLHRLSVPRSEPAKPEWFRRTALGDMLGTAVSTRTEDALYRHRDTRHPPREQRERELAERETALFKLEETISRYDLTSTSFEGPAGRNRPAKRGDARDQRPDGKPGLVGVGLDRDGCPQAPESFAGHRQDRSPGPAMLARLKQRTGQTAGATVVVARGMASEENLAQLRAQGVHYMVAGRQEERHAWLAELAADDWDEVLRPPSPRTPHQHKSRVPSKRRQQGNDVDVLGRSAGREEKARAIRQTHEQRRREALEALRGRIEQGPLKETAKSHHGRGRLKERPPRVARSYRIAYDAARQPLSWQEDTGKKAVAEPLDGRDVLKPDRQELSADELWRTYTLLTRGEAAFRALKSPLMERPSFHHLQRRTETHIVLCILAYHLLGAIEKKFVDPGMHPSWWSIRQPLSTHQVVTVVLSTSNGPTLQMRQGTTPEPTHRALYATLRIPLAVMQPKIWHENVP